MDIQRRLSFNLLVFCVYTSHMKNISILIVIILSILFTGCGVRSIPMQQNEVEASWSEVLNQYQRRADLIPNLVNTVKGYAKHEKETLESVVNARSKATQTNIDFKNLNDAKLADFQKAQGELSSALSRLLVVAEKYPDLKANENFRDLQAQLEGTENRITVARKRFIDQVKEFNNLVSVFPTNISNSLFFHYEKKPQFKVENEKEIAAPPKVSF